MKNINRIRRRLGETKRVLALYQDPTTAFDDTWRELMIVKLKEQIALLESELIQERIKEDEELDRR